MLSPRTKIIFALAAFASLAIPAAAHAQVGETLVADLGKQSLFRIDPDGTQHQIPIGVPPNSVAAEAGGVYVGSDAGIYRIDTSNGATTPITTTETPSPNDVAVAHGVIYTIADNPGGAAADHFAAFKIIPGNSVTKLATFAINDLPIAIGAGQQNQVVVYTQSLGSGGILWAVDASGKTLIDSGGSLSGNGVIGTPTGAGIAFTDAGAMYVANAKGFGGNDGLITNLTAPLGLSDPVGLATEANGKVLVADAGFDELDRIDPATGDQTVLSPTGQFQIPVDVAVDRCPVGCSVGPPTVPPPLAATSAAKKSQKIGKSKNIVVTVSCNVACQATISGSVTVGSAGKSNVTAAKKKKKSKATKLKPVTQSIAAGKSTDIKIKLSSSLVKKIKKAARKHKKSTATLTVATVAGADRKSSKLSVKLKP